MNQSYESDTSLSPSQILDRLQMLRQLQLMQRGKLQKQQLQYQENSETSSCITELISHFTNSVNTTSYNTFQSLLQSSPSVTDDGSPRFSAGNSCRNVQDKDLIDGVSVLNLSQESEFIVNTPTSARSRASAQSNSHVKDLPPNDVSNSLNNDNNNISKKNVISLDEMPILSPRKDFESLVIEKLQSDKSAINTKSSKEKIAPTKKKTFLKRGEGMTRFGLKKNNLVIQSTTSLPWKKKNVKFTKSVKEPLNVEESKYNNEKSNEDIVVPPLKLKVKRKSDLKLIEEKCNNTNTSDSNVSSAVTTSSRAFSDNNSSLSTQSEFKVPDKIINLPKGKHPILASKGKTWASILTKEQNDFLSQLKQSDYYKNFASPAKSTTSDLSCDEHTSNLRQEKESAEQNLFELLENKVSHESFHLENSFFNRFLKRSTLECSGESTPIVMQRCLANNPKLMHILPESARQRNVPYNDVTCQSDYTECCSDACSSVSSCCSCKTATEPPTPETRSKEHFKEVPHDKKEVQVQVNDTCQNEVDKEHDTMKANMLEMNEKLISTSEILKQRLQELEDEIETFRKENMNLNKMKEDVDLERQKFYEEKKNFEQKFNEEKILSEYYLAEEKEKLNKQKQMYERYVREMRGRLNKKEKDEVVNLKQEISSLKEEIKIKDAKSTSTIARLRNQMKIIEKEKSELQNEVEKLKKENRRIQHSNEITWRMTNMKYLEQINKKLSNMNKEPQVEVQHQNDIKYKAFEIERQSRSRKAQQAEKVTIRPRAKSVPNLKVTSRYAKYFSQRDVISHRDQNNTDIKLDIPLDDSDDEILRLDNANENSDNSTSSHGSDTNNDNNLEDIYMNTFRTNSPKSNRSSMSNPMLEINPASSNSEFFLRRSNSSSSTRDSKSPVNLPDRSSFKSKSPISILSHRSSQRCNTHISSNISGESNSSHSSKSPATTNHWSQRLPTVIHKDISQDKLSVTPEPTTSKSNLSKSTLNPTEYRKPDGSRELRFPNGNVKHISADGKYTKFVYYNGDVKENFYDDGRIKYYYSESKTYHTTHADGLEILEFPDGQVEKRYKDGSSEVRLPNGSVRYHDPKNTHVREEWRFPDGSALTVAANGERRVTFANGQIEVHAQDHKRREFPDGTVKLVYNDGTSETRYASGRVRIKDKHGNLIMDSASASM